MRKKAKISKNKMLGASIGLVVATAGTILRIKSKGKVKPEAVSNTVVKTTEVVKDLGPKAVQYISKSRKGIGFTAREIAAKAGILYKTSGNANPKVVKTVIKRIGGTVVGGIDKSIYSYKNGGRGLTEIETPLFDLETAEKVIKYIKENAVKIGEGLYKLHDKVFRM